jgi:hypothetical protein
MFAILLAAAFMLAAAPAFAATAVTIPYGDWIGSVASTLAALTVPAVAWGLRFLPGHVVAVIRMTQVDQLLERSIIYGINSVAGASQGKALSVDVGSRVLAEAMTYAIKNGPGWLLGWLGGEAGVRQRIIARLSLEPQAALK